MNLQRGRGRLTARHRQVLKGCDLHGPSLQCSRLRIPVVRDKQFGFPDGQRVRITLDVVSNVSKSGEPTSASGYVRKRLRQGSGKDIPS